MKRKLIKKLVVFLFSCALVFVSYSTMTTLAKYISSLNISGNISVAKWDVSVVGEDNKKLPPMFIGQENTYQSYELSVISKSEIAINYTIIIRNVPTGVQIQIDDNINPYVEVDGIVNIDDLEDLEAGNHTRNHILTILVPSGIEPFTDRQLDIDVIFTQVNL